MNYNTVREAMNMPEYGRHILDMVNHLKTIEDPEKRQAQAECVINIMGALNPHLKTVDQYKHLLWTHLFYIANFELDVRSPYPIPTKESLFEKPKPLPYPQKNNKYRHLGKNLIALIEQAKKETGESKLDVYTKVIAYYMKLSYNAYHQELVPDEVIKEELKILSGGLLNYTIGDVKVKFKPASNHSNNKRNNHHNNRKGGSKGKNRKRY